MQAGGARFTAPMVVNAAGAWADEVARLAGAAPIGLQPMRRTAVLVDPPAGVPVDDWPMVLDVEETFYFKPDAGWDRQAPGFFWLAGQGGYGIQTAPAMARTAAALLTDQPPPGDLADAGVDPTALSPERLRTPAAASAVQSRS